MTLWFRVEGSDLQVSLCKLVLGAVVYHLWKRRNDSKHGNVASSEDQMLKRIDWEIRTRIMGVGKFADYSLNRFLCCKWGFQDCILCKRLFWLMFLCSLSSE